MSVFAPRFYNEPSFNGLFRLIDEFDQYASQSSGENVDSNNNNNKVARQGGGSRLTLPTFTPKFDLKETETSYELHGDLPGINKEDVHLEFTDDHTLRISGRVERSHTSGDASLVGGDKKTQVEEEAEDADKGKQVTKTPSDNDKQVSGTTAPAPKVKYWVSERSVGEFARTFNFPTHVDAEAISAKLDNGVLNVVVPKAKKPEGRRIAIQ
ncbi:small heat shock protein [Truncatella angustata]|uniref:Small heat shock protein n=1 Tax=Truncatella angustata TaxID=152316 RepID=A0A9P9A026_9PEZI|nr:small heat shock protein [Truncatella angustata]KAH6655599.1 small heat shock protein [Truncatella angustata]